MSQALLFSQRGAPLPQGTMIPREAEQYLYRRIGVKWRETVTAFGLDCHCQRDESLAKIWGLVPLVSTPCFLIGPIHCRDWVSLEFEQGPKRLACSSPLVPVREHGVGGNTSFGSSGWKFDWTCWEIFEYPCASLGGKAVCCTGTRPSLVAALDWRPGSRLDVRMSC